MTNVMSFMEVKHAYISTRPLSKKKKKVNAHHSKTGVNAYGKTDQISRLE